MMPFNLPPGWVAPLIGLSPTDILSALQGSSQSHNGPLWRGPRGPWPLPPEQKSFQDFNAGQAPTGPTPSDISGISGFNPSLVSLGISSVSPFGGPFAMANQAYSLANNLGALPGNQMVDQQGNPAFYSGPRSLTGLMGSVLGWGKTPTITVQPFDEMGLPAQLQELQTARQFTETAPGSQTFNANAPQGWFSLPGLSPQFNFNPSPKQGIGIDDTAVDSSIPSLDEAEGVGFSNGFGEGGGGGAGGGDSHICTLLYDQNLMDRGTWVSNARFKASMSPSERRGYDKWAYPLTQWLRRHPRAFKVAYKAFGWMPRAYMREIRYPGSSKVGKTLLTLGLKGCAWLGSRA